MANRFVLNTISYHGSGAIKEIPGELQRRGYKKIFVCSDPDLVKFGVTAKVTDELDAAGIAWSLYSEIKPNPTIQNVKDGVEAFKAAEADALVTPLVEMLLRMRMEAKAAKDWATSDRIRDELTAIGIRVKDRKDGFDWEIE